MAKGKQAEEAKTEEQTEEQPSAAVAENPQNTELAAPGSYGEFGTTGFEDMGSDEISLPFLSILQALSPQVSGEAAIDGAKAGQLFNTVTEEFFEGKEGIGFVPVHREKVFVEWVPRDQGGGFVGRHEPSSEVVTQAKAQAAKPNELKTEDGNDLVETGYLTGLLVHDDGRTEPVVVSFTSTKLKKYRHLLTKLSQFTVMENGRKVTPPIFAHKLKITTVSEKNSKGNFYNFNIGSAAGSLKEGLLSPEDELFQEAHQLRQMVDAGKAKANYDSQNEAAGEGSDDTPF